MKKNSSVFKGLELALKGYKNRQIKSVPLRVI